MEKTITFKQIVREFGRNACWSSREIVLFFLDNFEEIVSETKAGNSAAKWLHQSILSTYKLYDLFDKISHSCHPAFLYPIELSQNAAEHFCQFLETNDYYSEEYRKKIIKHISSLEKDIKLFEKALKEYKEEIT